MYACGVHILQFRLRQLPDDVKKPLHSLHKQGVFHTQKRQERNFAGEGTHNRPQALVFGRSGEPWVTWHTVGVVVAPGGPARQPCSVQAPTPDLPAGVCLAAETAAPALRNRRRPIPAGPAQRRRRGPIGPQ